MIQASVIANRAFKVLGKPMLTTLFHVSEFVLVHIINYIATQISIYLSKLDVLSLIHKHNHRYQYRMSIVYPNYQKRDLE